MSATLGTISEVAPGGSIVANASLASSSWTETNFSSEDAYDLGYTVHAPVTGPLAPFPVYGAVDARIDFVLPIYAGSPSGPTDTVSVGVFVSNWSWTNVGDHLVLTLVAWPSYPAEEKMVLGGSPGSLVSSAAVTSGTTLEQLSVSTTAVANPGVSAGTLISATSSVLGNASRAVISIAFGTTAGPFTALSYVASVRVLFPTTVAGIPTVDLVAVGGGAALVAFLLGAGAHRMRRRPSDLTYVEEEP
jgi:hypothetical protein